MCCMLSNFFRMYHLSHWKGSLLGKTLARNELVRDRETRRLTSLTSSRIGPLGIVFRASADGCILFRAC